MRQADHDVHSGTSGTDGSSGSLVSLALSSPDPDHQGRPTTAPRLPADAAWNFSDVVGSFSRVVWSEWNGDDQLTGFTRTQQISWGVMQTVVMAVISQTIVEFTCPEKSLAAALTLAVVVPLSMGWIKFRFNLSGALKKDFDFNAPVNFAHIVILLALAFGLYYSHKGEDVSPLGYNSVIIVPGICLKLLTNYFATASHSEVTGHELGQREPLLISATEDESASANAHAGKWYNHVAMHGLVRLPLLFSATNAGGQFFEGMQIPLAEGIEACGLTNFAGIVAFSALLNEIIGAHLFKWSGQFKEVHPNPVSRTMTMCGLAITLQMTNIFKVADLGTFAAAFAIAFIADLLVQESGLGFKIDQAAGQIVSTLQAKCCQWQPASAA
ncbi:MAG: hypothetical protein KBD83_09210, partial [Gammaproteobacteria bacterium]|nr:hypothetical protein [Gammaproteobacteria bacterium]